ncbi:MAG: hypothetical protein DCC51_02080 [Anaerolineae bacterium]|nr:MAG: hypothetical protein DCC51_02080 [Anaerolineae bacterium]
MDRRSTLLNRLDAIGHSLERSESALALIGLGSVGRELNRLDDHSDLDFFVIVESGRKRAYLDDLSWLSAAHPLSFTFLNTDDGYKFLFADGIYGEMAVFEPNELTTAVYSPGRLVWRREDVPESWAAPHNWPPSRRQPSVEWTLGEALTNLYVGLSRFRRGEKLSACRFIQHYAVDRVLDLISWSSQETTVAADPFDMPRRFEQRYPEPAQTLPKFMQGYERSIESANAILEWLDARYEVNPAMKEAILSLASA